MSDITDLIIFIASIIKPIIVEAIDERLREHLPQKPENEDDERFLTRRNAAYLLGVNTVTLDKMCKEGKLNKHRHGTLVRLKKSEVMNFLQTYEKRKRGQFPKAPQNHK